MASRTTENFDANDNRRATGLRKALDYLLAVSFIAVGIVCILRFRPDTAMIALGILAILYGLRKGYKAFRNK